MKRRNVLFGFLLLFLFTGLAGCITDAGPDPGQTISMAIGDVQEFTVTGSASVDFHFEWYIKFGNTLDLQGQDAGETSTFEFTADPQTVSNKLAIVCKQVHISEWGWQYIPPVTLDSREWQIEIPRMPPIWQGNYIVEDKDDLVFLQENGYEEITNDLIIKSNTLTVVEELNGIKKVGGSIIIRSNPLLRKITGLNDITSVTGNIDITKNSILTSIEGFNNLTSVDGNIDIKNNLILISTEGFNSLTSVAGYLDIWSNIALVSLEGLNNLTSVGGYLSIEINNRLTNLNGLNNLVSVGELLGIGLNERLESLEGLDSLTSVGSLIIEYNDKLASLEGLINLDSVGNDFNIVYNPELCTYLAEELRNQVEAGSGIGGIVSIDSNKDCSIY